MLAKERFFAMGCAFLAGAASCSPEVLAQNQVDSAAQSSFLHQSPAAPQRASDNTTSVVHRQNTEQSGARTTPLLKGQASYCVPRGTPVKLKIAVVPEHPIKMMDRDLDGDLLPARLNQEITAKVTEDMYVDDNKVIPEGTVFHGHVTNILAPRRVNRPGSLVISFDELVTPDGRRFAFKAEADSSKASTAKTKAKGFARISAYAAGGAFVGAMVAYQIFGLHETIAMHGYNIAGAAAGGALLASGYAIMKKGKRATLEPGDDLNMSLDADLLMPAAVEPHKTHFANMDGVRIKINRTKLMPDGLDGHMLRMNVSIANDSDHRLNSIDLFLEDSNGNRYPLIAGPEDESEFLFEVDPHTEKNTALYFQVEWPKLKRTLVWLNHDSRKIAYKLNCQ